MDSPLIVSAGATGDLGGRIARELLSRGASVRAIARPASDAIDVKALRRQGVEIAEAAYDDASALAEACEGASCVVSALSGLRDVIVEAQTSLLDAAVEADVPRFIPSDYCIDYRGLTPGTNRNLDLRRTFRERLDQAPIAATSVFNGMFADLLIGPAPVVLFPLRRVVCWGDADQPLDFTTQDDTAAVTAAAALDEGAPRDLQVAGDVLSSRRLADAASEATGKSFKTFRAGGISRLNLLIKLTRTLVPSRGEVFPPWQGMQYLRDMFSGEAKLDSLDNERYPDIEWTPVRDVLAAR